MQLVGWLLFIFYSLTTSAQMYESEKVNWTSLESFTCQELVFKTNDVELILTQAEYVELRSMSGVSGYFIIGKGTIKIPSKDISDIVNAAQIRINPNDSIKFLKITNPVKNNSKGFAALSLLILNDTFRRSFHSAMDAIIPPSNNFNLNLFTKENGDIAIYNDGTELGIFKFQQKGSK